MKKILGILLVLGASLSGCTNTEADILKGEKNDSIKVYDESSEKTILSKKGDYFIVELKENPTTGYQINYEKEDESIVKLIKDEYRTDDNGEKIVGAGGIHYYLFEVTENGETDLNFKYKRSFEEKEINTVIYTVKAVEDAPIKYEVSLDDNNLNVKMINIGENPIGLSYNSGAEFEVILTKDEKEAYRYTMENMFLMVMVDKEIKKDEYTATSINVENLEKGIYKIEVYSLAKEIQNEHYIGEITIK